MKMDIACPVEMLRFEQADFGEERRQAYLTFLNESTYVITAVSGRVALLDRAGKELEEQYVSFGSLSARPGEAFTCHLALDGFPQFDDAEMLIGEVMFEGEEPWAMNPSRVHYYDPPVQEEGPARNALVAIAGRDAICYPSQVDTMWICVCGRYNRRRWIACRRCRRERDAVLEYTPERVGALFEAQVQEQQQAPPRVLINGAPRPPRPPRDDRPQRPAPKTRKRKRRQPLQLPDLRSQGVVVVIAVLVTVLLFWGTISIGRRLSGISGAPEQSIDQPQAIPMDYLEAL